MKDKPNFIVIDTETSGRDPHTCHLLEIAAMVIDNRTLEPIDGGVFVSKSKPDVDINDPSIEQQALDVNHIKRTDIEEFPEEKIVWNNFVDFARKYKVGKTQWGLCYPVGHNILGFDLPILNRLQEKYKTKPIFHKNIKIDTILLSYLWLESCHDIDGLSLDKIRSYFGITNTSGLTHTALVDVQDTAAYFIRMMNFHRKHSKKAKFKDSFKNA